ncbi:MAG: putative Ig domain-containing protein [Acidobacteria bacterium]|nr:putative Ig domain-containing protein [Acidobacteriota bacterium]
MKITTAKLPIGIVGSYYSVRLTARGGVSPYRWAVSEGALPAGLVLDSATGEVSGTPTQFTRAALELRVEDSSAPENQESSIMLPVTIEPDHLIIVTSGLPQAIIGKQYTVNLDAAGGTKPYTWSIKDGSLPSGLELDSHLGVIHGKPTQGGTSIFALQVTDSSSPPASVAYRFPSLSGADISSR